MEVAQLSHPRSILDPPDAPAAPAPVAAPVVTSSRFDAAIKQLLESDSEFRHFRASSSLQKPTGLVDFLIATDDEPHEPDDVFTRIRWGGQFVYLTRNASNLEGLADRFEQRGFMILRGPAAVHTGLLKFLGLGRKVHYLTARKTFLTRPKEITERFTYHVQLVPAKPQMMPYAVNGCVVQKEVPSIERVIGRLRAKFTDVSDEVIQKRARKFTEKIFPLFLTREAAMLKILERDLPIAYRDRVPRVISMEQDERGYVRRLWMNWLRARTPRHQPLTQLEFARQSADLLRVMHDEANIIHLDLRLDNVVITDRGVGFVDFGSAVREGENIQGNPLLSTIFDELMRTSQIQKMLDRMMTEGKVTSHVLGNAYGKVDKGVDLFYLAVSINAPLINPDFQGLVTHDTAGEESAGLSMLTQDVLKPRDPSNPPIKSARDLLRSIEGLSFALRGRGLRRRIGEG